MFDINDEGINIGEPVLGYEGLLGASPTKVSMPPKRLS